MSPKVIYGQKHFLMTEGGGHCREAWDMMRSNEVIEKGPEAADMVGQSVAKIAPPAGLRFRRNL
jgi:hypothetical protein